MVKRTGLLFLASFVAGAAIVSACTPKSNSADSSTVGPTPTPSGTGTGTPTPSGTPDVSPVISWVSPDGKELWLRFQALNFSGSVVNITTRALNCTSSLPSLALTVSSGQMRTVRFDSPGMNCATGTHAFDLDWADKDGGCTGGCVTDSKHFTMTMSNVFQSTSAILKNVSARLSPTTGALRFSAVNGSNQTITLEYARVYKSGSLVQECATTAQIAPSTEPALFDTCKPAPASMVAASYDAWFKGTLGDGTEYWEFTSFPYQPF